MIKKLLIGGVLGLVFTLSGFAEEPVAQNFTEDPWFEVGEAMEYKIYWGVFHVANSTAITEWIEQDGRKLIRIEFRTQSNSFIEKFYPVDDRLEAVIDPETFLPLTFVKKLSEGRYRADESTIFDHEEGRAHFTKIRKDGSIREESYVINPDTRDLITMMYYMRSKDFTLGQKSTLEVMADEKLYDLFLSVSKKEKVDLENYGKVDTLKIDPEAKFEGLFVRKGKMTVWATEGDQMILAKVSAKVPVASIRIMLYKVSGPGSEKWIPLDDLKNDEKSTTSNRSMGRRGR